MDKLNIAELLKDCPSGMELNCTMYEDVYFDYVDELQIIHCYIQRELCKTSITFNQYGTPNSDIKSKCVIFPKDKTTWKGFQRLFKDGDIVTCKGGSALVACIYKERRNTSVFSYYIALYKSGLGIIEDGEITLTDDCLCFASEEEKQRLFSVIKENGYKWNAETKTLEELAPNKFDIATLKPFDKVLVRGSDLGCWMAHLFSFYDTNCITIDPYKCISQHNGGYAQCIPYEGNEHLLSTTNDCDDFYKTW